MSPRTFAIRLVCAAFADDHRPIDGPEIDAAWRLYLIADNRQQRAQVDTIRLCLGMEVAA